MLVVELHRRGGDPPRHKKLRGESHRVTPATPQEFKKAPRDYWREKRTEAIINLAFLCVDMIGGASAAYAEANNIYKAMCAAYTPRRTHTTPQHTTRPLPPPLH
jgi:hypothetical protein